MKMLITGANGYVGRNLVHALSLQHDIVAVTRTPHSFPESSTNVVIESLTDEVRWSKVLEGVDAVIHLAARVHVLKEESQDPLSEFLRTNVDGSLAVARASITAGVKRFIFVSSIKVNGEETTSGPLKDTDLPEPMTDYGVSKLEAEVALRQLFERTGTELIIVRPPMIYGPSSPGNTRRLIRLIQTKLPLPFRSIDNRRTFLSIGNLVTWFERILTSEDSPANPILIGDPKPASIRELLEWIGNGMGKKVLLVPFPRLVLENGARLVGLKDTMTKLTRDLEVQVDFSKYPGIEAELALPSDEFQSLGRESAGGK